MKSFIQLTFLLPVFLLSFFSCEKDDVTEPTSGDMSIDFDNIAIIDGNQRQLSMVETGNLEYSYTNGMNQDFNITLLKYFVSKIVLEGPDGAYYADEMEVNVNDAKGYYLIDESKPESQKVFLRNVPVGKYNKISFTLGVDEEGVVEGVAGGSLDPTTNGMFWNWNSGYVALKLEGHSSASPGGASNNTVNLDVENGMAYHVGGWKNIDGTAFVYNNERLEYTFDTDLSITGNGEPNVHMVMDVLALFDGTNTVDFSGNNNVHKPTDGAPIAENFVGAFAFDHIHQ